MKKTLLIVGLLQLWTIIAIAQDSTYPVPPKPPGHLFYLQHTRNQNTVMYEVNLKDGKPDPEKPVHVYWIRYSERGQVQELNDLQRRLAYGIHSEPMPDGTYMLNIVSSKKFKVHLKPSANGSFSAFTMINQHPAILTRLFINIVGGTQLSPKIEYVQISGVDVESKKPVSEKVKI